MSCNNDWTDYKTEDEFFTPGMHTTKNPKRLFRSRKSTLQNHTSGRFHSWTNSFIEKVYFFWRVLSENKKYTLRTVIATFFLKDTTIPSNNDIANDS